MALKLQSPLTYLITSGETTRASHRQSDDFQNILALVQTAVAARVSLIQLREKNLHARTLYELTARAAAMTRGSATRLLVNDRADIARAAEADGVHLATRSLCARIVRRTFGEDFLIGVSTHTLAQARAARDGGADFAVFGPVFETPAKQQYGAAVGPDQLSEAARTLSPFPLIALGGITLDNAQEALRAGACGVAAIRLFNDASSLEATIRALMNHA